MAAPDFKIDVPGPQQLSRTFQPASTSLAPPGGGAPNALNEGLAKLGDAASTLGAKIQHAQDQTVAAQQTTDYLTRLDDLEQEAKQNPDFKAAPEEFATKQRELEMELSANIGNDQLRAKAGLEWRRAGLAAGKRVQATSWSKMVDASSGADDAQARTDLRDADSAASPVERAVAIDRRMRSIKDGVEAGIFSAADGERRTRTFMGTLDDLGARRLGADNPAAAIKALNDPEQFKWLSPERKQTLIEAFQSQNDARQTAEQNNLARVNPPAAVTNVGVAQPAQFGMLYNSVLKIESDGQAGAVSSKGALGLSQIMPDTARDMAKRLGFNDVAALDDAALKDRLLTDTKLNTDLGREYWNWLGARYGGSVPAMLAGYNAGPKRADEWARKATETYGPNYTLGQYAQVVDIPETKSYLEKYAKVTGVALDAPAFNRTTQLHAAASVGQQLDQQDAHKRQLYSAQAAAVSEGNDFAEMFRNGQTPDPLAYGLFIQANARAAQSGDAASYRRLADAQFQERMAPARAAAYRMAPAQLSATIAGIEAEQRSRPVTQDDIDKLSVLKEVYKDVQTRAKSDPISLAERSGIAPATALDPQADPGTLAQVLSARGGIARAAQSFQGGEYKVLKPDEATALKVRFGQASEVEQLQILRAAGGALDERGLHSFVDQIGGDGSLQFIARAATDRPALAQEILHGKALLGQKDVQDKGDLIRTALQNKLGGEIYPAPQMQDAAVRAALYLDASRRAGRGSLYDKNDASGVEQAIEDITGALIKRNGVKVPAPPGMPASTFERALDNISEGDINQFGGAYDRNGKALAAGFVGRNAVLKPLEVGGSRYVVGVADRSTRDNFQPIFTGSETPEPLVIDMRAIGANAEARRRAGLTPYQRQVSAFRAGQAERIGAAREGVEP